LVAANSRVTGNRKQSRSAIGNFACSSDRDDYVSTVLSNRAALNWRSKSSTFLGGLKVQPHTLSRWFANVEIYIYLFVAFGVLLSPQNQQKRRKLGKDNLRPVDLRVTSRTESDHQMQQRLARFPMMDSGIGITTHPTGVSIAL
jgi:hypothetical protein